MPMIRCDRNITSHHFRRPVARFEVSALSTGWKVTSRPPLLQHPSEFGQQHYSMARIKHVAPSPKPKSLPVPQCDGAERERSANLQSVQPSSQSRKAASGLNTASIQGSIPIQRSDARSELKLTRRNFMPPDPYNRREDDFTRHRAKDPWYADTQFDDPKWVGGSYQMDDMFGEKTPDHEREVSPNPFDMMSYPNPTSSDLALSDLSSPAFSVPKAPSSTTTSQTLTSSKSASQKSAIPKLASPDQSTEAATTPAKRQHSPARADSVVGPKKTKVSQQGDSVIPEDVVQLADYIKSMPITPVRAQQNGEAVSGYPTKAVMMADDNLAGEITRKGGVLKKNSKLVP